MVMVGGNHDPCLSSRLSATLAKCQGANCSFGGAVLLKTAGKVISDSVWGRTPLSESPSTSRFETTSRCVLYDSPRG
jgi:hypothetical protein